MNKKERKLLNVILKGLTPEVSREIESRVEECMKQGRQMHYTSWCKWRGVGRRRVEKLQDLGVVCEEPYRRMKSQRAFTEAHRLIVVECRNRVGVVSLSSGVLIADSTRRNVIRTAPNVPRVRLDNYICKGDDYEGWANVIRFLQDNYDWSEKQLRDPRPERPLTLSELIAMDIGE